MRALLVVNPKATATTTRMREVLVGALGHDLKLDIAETHRRGHARELARHATEDGLDVVVALGGDGTVNEVVNGMLAHGPGVDVPSLAVVPGGSTNVFTRALGLPQDPVEATGALIEALRSGRRRVVGLGHISDPDGGPTADDRWFTFCAGLGLDAEVVREVEVKRRKGSRSTPGLYVRTALSHFFAGTDRRHPVLTVQVPGEEPIDGVFFTVISNARPWTYLGNRAVNPNPLADFDAGLDLFALRRLRTVGTLRVLRQILMGGELPHGRQVLTRHDEGELVLVASRPLACQVDGEYLGERETVRVRAVPQALSVIV
jgi:diacylglycerol kinase family enzyme